MSMEQSEIDRLGRLFAVQGRALPPIKVLSPGEVPMWLPIDQAPPSGKFLVRGPSGYIPPNDVFVVLAHREPAYRGDAWLFPSGDRLSDAGWEPAQFMPFFTAMGFHK